jgi:hypothetical protein
MPKKKSTSYKKRKPQKKTREKKQLNASSNPPHAWRLCPAGQYWVRTHPMQVPPSRAHPEGFITTRHEHCRHNPSGKDQLYPDEILEIAKEHFSKVKVRPCPQTFKYGPSEGAYDELIAGWVYFWNEVFQPDVSLDPNLFKALIATESGFDPNVLADPKDPKSARGLAQITDETRKILGDERGELRDHYITITREELRDPNVNICAGVRWLFHKRHLASTNLGRQATWEEAVAEYKSIRKGLAKGRPRAKELMNRFLGQFRSYTKCGK